MINGHYSLNSIRNLAVIAAFKSILSAYSKMLMPINAHKLCIFVSKLCANAYKIISKRYIYIKYAHKILFILTPCCVAVSFYST